MQKITFSILHKRLVKYISTLAITVSLLLVYGFNSSTNFKSDMLYLTSDVSFKCFENELVYGPLTKDESSHKLFPFMSIFKGNNVINTNPGIGLIKTGVFNDLNNNGVADVGETISYSFNVKNTGQIILKDIEIQDPLVNVSGSLASLSVGQSNSSAFSAIYTLTQNDLSNCIISNQATATGCYQQTTSNGNCSGKVTYLKLKYLGSVQNAQIRIVQQSGETIFNSVVQPEGQFQIYGQSFQNGPPPHMSPSIDVFINNNFHRNIHTSCSVPIGPGSVFGDFEVIEGESRNGGPLSPVITCTGTVTDLSDNDSFNQNDSTFVVLPGTCPPTPRDCTCAPFHDNSNFVNPTRIAGNALQVGAVYRFSNVFPGGPLAPVDALIKIEGFNGGASLLDIDVTGTGLEEAFQPRINSTNSNDQSVDFSVTFVSGGGNYGDEVLISFFGTPLDIDGDPSGGTREYAELSLPDAYFLSMNTLIDISRGSDYIRGAARTIQQAPGGDVSLDPRFTYSNYFENASSFIYTIGKVDGNNDRYYSLDMDSADYTDPDSVLITYPVICGNVSDDFGSPLVGVEIDVTGSDGSSVTVTTDSSGNYKAIAAIPEALVNVDYEIRENDLPGYISISDVDGANDNLISRMIDLMSTCGNDFVDGQPMGWFFECEDKVVDEYGYNANCNTNTVVTIPGSDVYQYAVEIVYKGSNPGQTIQFTDSNGTSHTLNRSIPVGGSSNVWVYRDILLGSTTSVTYIDTTNECQLQSVVVYAFRENQTPVSSSAGVFTSRSGYNDIQVITIDIPAFSDGPRNLTIETPISELTEDGRYLLLRAEIGGISDELFIFGPDATLPGGTCCLAIPSITLNNVPGNETVVTITVDTRNGQNGQSVNGQSWVIASAVNVDGDCPVNTTFARNDINNTYVGQMVTGNVLTNDFDVQGDAQIVTTALGVNLTTTQGGTINFDVSGNGDYTYTPPALYAGADTFQYSIEDDAAPPRIQATDTATVFIKVIGDPNVTIAMPIQRQRL